MNPRVWGMGSNPTPRAFLGDLYDINKSEKIKGSLRRTTLSHNQTNGPVHIKEDKEIEMNHHYTER